MPNNEKYPPDPPETCRYCEGNVELVDDKHVYGESYDSYLFYCHNCGARVGTHDYNLKPFGILANAELRRWRGVAHAAFDPLHEKTKRCRNQAYKEIFGDGLGFPEHKHHIGMLTLEEVKKTVAWLMMRGPEI